LNVGQLTYQLQQVLLTFIEDRELKYQTLAECLGALEGAKLDLIERVVKPYEAKKAEENGDVWPASLTSEEERILTNPDVQAGFARLDSELLEHERAKLVPAPLLVPRRPSDYGGWD
jgi:hypothetical protein